MEKKWDHIKTFKIGLEKNKTLCDEHEDSIRTTCGE